MASAAPEVAGRSFGQVLTGRIRSVWSGWVERFVGRQAGAVRRRALNGALLGVEPLEDRTVPALDFGYALDLNGRIAPWDMATDASGNTYLVGEVAHQVDLQPGPEELVVRGRDVHGKDYYAGPRRDLAYGDGFIAKYDPSGRCIWAKSFIPSLSSAGHLQWGYHTRVCDLEFDPAGNLVLVGSFDTLMDARPGQGEARISTDYARWGNVRREIHPGR